MFVEMDVLEPLVFAPSGAHRYTIILLHGRGRNASAFASEMAALQQAFPQVKLIFPWAPRRRATVYKKSLTRQWFDDWHLSPELQSTDVVHSRYDEGLQTSGLGETVLYLHSLIAKEALLVGGAQNVVIGGFSQGAAACLVAAMLWEGRQTLGGVLALCAWLPYMSQMDELLGRGEKRSRPDTAIGDEQDEDEFDPFERPPSQIREDDEFVDGVQASLEWLQEEIGLPQRRFPRRHGNDGTTRVIFCHGLDDEKVAPERSQKASDFLPTLGWDSVERKTYPDVKHETSGGMIADLVAFLCLALGVEHI